MSTPPGRFRWSGKVLLGDDTKSQVGTTVFHRALLSLLVDRGIRVTQTYQLNVGGNSDFENMRDPERGQYKAETKRAALEHLLGSHSVPITAGPNGSVPQLRDHKVGYIQIDGVGVLGMPVSLEVKLRVEDSPNAAAVAVNAIRAARLATDRGLCGTVDDICAQLFKHPPRAMSNDEASSAFEAFVAVGRIAEQ